MLGKVLQQADDDLPHHIERLQRYIRQPSISATRVGIDDMAALLADEIDRLGGVGRVVASPEFPIVYGRFDEGAERTVLIHGMYDVTPADEADWVVPPFSAARMALGDLGECIVGRGAEDTKGPLSSVLSMLASFRRAKVPLPANVILVFEASELGSGGLPDFVERHRCELRADVAYWPWHTQRLDGTGVAWLGVKGLITLKLRCRGGAWGGPRNGEIHGSHSVWIGNPAQRLIHALASLRTPDDLDVAIDGFDDGKRVPTEDDERLLRVLLQRFSHSEVLRQAGSARFKQDTFEQALRAQCFEPTLNVSGLQAGVVIEDAHKVIVPDEAVASIDIRPVAGMTVEGTLAAIRRHLDNRGYGDITLEQLNGYVGGGTPFGSWPVRELLATYEEMGIALEVWPCAPVSIAAGLFTDRLGIPWIASAPGHAGCKHAANEYLQVEGYHRAIDFIVRLVWRLAYAGPGDQSRHGEPLEGGGTGW